MNNSSYALNDRVGLRAPLLFAAAILVGAGFIYSLVGTALGLSLFPDQANGSLIVREGRVVGSRLVAQPFADSRYFHSRPSAAGYDPMAAAGSNMARSNPDLRKRINDAIAAVASREGIETDDVPADMATQSGGGLDPHVSPQGARVQVARVARSRGISEASVLALVDQRQSRDEVGAETERDEQPEEGLHADRGRGDADVDDRQGPGCEHPEHQAERRAERLP